MIANYFILIMYCICIVYPPWR